MLQSLMSQVGGKYLLFDADQSSWRLEARMYQENASDPDHHEGGADENTCIPSEP